MTAFSVYTEGGRGKFPSAAVRMRRKEADKLCRLFFICLSIDSTPGDKPASHRLPRRLDYRNGSKINFFLGVKPPDADAHARALISGLETDRLKHV